MVIQRANMRPVLDQWRHVLLTLALSLAASANALDAQTPAGVARTAGATIPTAIIEYLGALAADSLQDRNTPSAGLERTARYLALEFQRLGLKPGIGVHRNGSPSWFQRYLIPGHLQVNPKSVVSLIAQLARHGQDVVDEAFNPGVTSPVRKYAQADFTQYAYFAPEVGPQMVAGLGYEPFYVDPFTAEKQLIVVSGRQSLTSIRRFANELRDKSVLYVPAPGVDSGLRRDLIVELYTTSQRLLVAATEDSAHFMAAAAEAAHQQPATFLDYYMQNAAGPRTWPWAVWVRGDVLRDFLVAAEIDLTQLQTDTVPLVRVVPASVAYLRLWSGGSRDTTTAPNVLGLLEGSDPTLKDQCIVISAHMDNGGAITASDHPVKPGRPDDVSPTADDNTAGVAALLALARAFRQPGMRPRRSVLFLATSGGAKDLWGANRFAETGASGSAREWDNIVLDVNLDRLDWPANDTLWVDGLREVELPTKLTVIATTHPELGLHVVGGETVVQPSSDHFAFVREAIPSLYFHTRSLADDSLKHGRLAPLDPDRLARIARLIFYLSDDLSTATQRPQWSTDGHRQLRSLLSASP